MWCSDGPRFARRNVVRPAGISAGASNLKSLAVTMTTLGAAAPAAPDCRPGSPLRQAASSARTQMPDESRIHPFLSGVSPEESAPHWYSYAKGPRLGHGSGHRLG